MPLPRIAYFAWLFLLLFWLSTPALMLYAGTDRAGEPVEITGNIENVSGQWVRLASCYGDKFTVVDSVEQAAGYFFFTLPGDTPPGLYRLIYSETNAGLLVENRFVEFIVAWETWCCR